MKMCTKCSVEFESTTTSSWCKSCKRERARIMRLQRGQKPKEIYNDPLGIKTCRHCKVQKTLDNFYKADPKHSVQGVSTYCRPCRPIALPQNKEKSRLATAAYRQKNRDTYLIKHRVSQAKRRGLAVNGSVSAEQAKYLYAKTHCRYCKLYVEPKDRTADHIVPLKKGGLHDISNLDMACWTCNCSKRDKSEEEFLKFMRNKDVNFGQNYC